MRAVREVIVSWVNNGESPRLARKSKQLPAGYKSKYMLRDTGEENRKACRQSPARHRRLHLRTTIELPLCLVIAEIFYVYPAQI